MFQLPFLLLSCFILFLACASGAPELPLPGTAQLGVQRLQVSSLDSATMGVFTPWKSTDAAVQSSPPPQLAVKTFTSTPCTSHYLKLSFTFVVYLFVICLPCV